jgi:FkbM family methyltransferase
MLRYLLDRYFIKQPWARSLATRLLYGSGDRRVDLFGTSFAVNSVRENGYVRASKKMAHSSLLRDEFGVLLSLSSLLRPGDTFVDAGANVGLFCCTLNRFNRLWANPPIRFYAYEPHPDTFRRLQMNTVGTGIISRNLAVSDRAGDLEFVDGAVSSVFTVASRSSSYHSRRAAVIVPSVRLDEELIEGDSIILKIDVEDQELATLKGAQKLFELRLVKAVYLDGYADKVQVDTLLREFGFRFLNGRTLQPFVAGEFSLLAVQPDKMSRRIT